ncbi:hypothetical protein Xcc1_23150 [Xanthomonas campestris pv. campestris]|nr:hypothetical protein Xcc1_23150 [Xanthomonas campestris pv. campestris]
MLRIHLLQQWYALSDPAMEEALHEIPTLRRFAQLGGLDNVPDETTILNFRRLLETHGLAARMLEAVNAHLARKGQSLRSGANGVALTGSGLLPTQISGYGLSFREGFLAISTNAFLRVLPSGQTSAHRPSRHPAAHRAAREQPLAVLSG